ncbi:Protein kinase, putative [Hondaea fermentalgiana]|uniref:Protein kinase, putative n=1 Tax=Hondaea fermentalgiana TaxID=2315210 RepID=A0A2R5GV11_9STRA|nr:Protein kinase, putative [Hondaea fermentalgiana]|eukprot:GBG34687.1 Protein kinase, putative [Hondaea fermentalgiana]
MGPEHGAEAPRRPTNDDALLAAKWDAYTTNSTPTSSTTALPELGQAEPSAPRPGVAGRRDPMQAPVRKLSVNLIRTYKYINHVYYENKRRRQAQAQEEQQKQQKELQQQPGAQPETSSGNAATNTSTTNSSKRKPATTGTGASAGAGAGAGAKPATSNGNLYNNGHDDEHSDYLIRIGERINNRYVVKQRIGKGSFGQVVRAFDEERNEQVAVKIIKSRKPFFLQAQTEIELLQELNTKDQDDKWFIVRLLDKFLHHNHQCLVFEMLSFNLYDLLRNTQFEGVSLNLIRKFARQILKALHFLAREDVDVIHCDLKPENILLRHPKRSAIKVIDFGSSCKSDRQMYQYIQSRFYRSPEVILGRPYSVAIDMWSLGCILVEMHTGEPLFSGTDEHDQMIRLVAVRGMPPEEILDSSAKTHKFFEPNTNPETAHAIFRESKWKLKPRKGRSDPVEVDLERHRRSLHAILGINSSSGPAARRKNEPGHSHAMYETFIDLVVKMLNYDAYYRITPKDALMHPFIVSDRPTQGATGSARPQQAHLHSNQTASPAPMDTRNHGDGLNSFAATPDGSASGANMQYARQGQRQQQHHHSSAGAVVASTSASASGAGAARKSIRKGGAMQVLKKLMPHQVLFESKQLLVVNKAAGLLSQDNGDGTPNVAKLARSWVKSQKTKGGNVFVAPLHRLDRVASGVVCLALSSKAASRVSESFRERHVKKEYLAVVSGVLAPTGLIPGGTSYAEYWAKKQGSGLLDRADTDNDKLDGDLEWAVLNHPIDMSKASAKPMSLIAIRTATGRKHQIRRQLAGLGHPILGDVLYGSTYRFGKGVKNQPSPIMLHGSRMSIPNPVRPEPVKGGGFRTTKASLPKFLTFYCQPPKEWRYAISQLVIPDMTRKDRSYFALARDDPVEELSEYLARSLQSDR